MEIRIGEVIRKYRKEKNMTQEEMARRVGVSAPAVNKWEKGVSQPDISLLAPIARLLGITLETLLSFHEDLSGEEIAEIVREVDRRFETDSFDAAFEYVREKIREYPACYQLIWQLATIAEYRCLIGQNTDRPDYEARILEWFGQALQGGDAELQRNAAGSLFAYYMRQENYEEAGKYLSFFSEEGMERKRKQAVIYAKTGRRDEAYKTYEEILFTGYQMLDLVLCSLYALSVEDGCLERVGMWARKESSLAELFDMGTHSAQSCKLDLAVLEKDVPRTLEIVKALLGSITEIGAYIQSDMYAHMKFKEISPSFVSQYQERLIHMFRDKEKFAFMDGNEEWERLLFTDCYNCLEKGLS